MEECNLCHEKKHTIFTIRICKHKICHQCMDNHLKDFKSAKIECPVVTCKRIIQDSVIRECLSNDKLTYYDALCCPSNIFKCLIKDCNYFIAYDDKNVQFQCQRCQQSNCVSCGKLHNENEPCGTDNRVKCEKDASRYIDKIKRDFMEAIDQSDDLIPNPESFTCELCTEFFLPRKGVTLRNCLHTFCNDCLILTFGDSKYFNQLVCSNCSTLLHERERRKLIGSEKLNLMSIEVLKTRFFPCKECDCDGIWDVGDYKGMYRCPKCKKVNCIACESIHENKTCEEFRKSKDYQTITKFQKDLKKKGDVSCFNCRRMLAIQPGRCGALLCDKCNTYVCQFTGKSVGVGGCNCTSANPCHKDCKYGCIPEH